MDLVHRKQHKSSALPSTWVALLIGLILLLVLAVVSWVFPDPHLSSLTHLHVEAQRQQPRTTRPLIVYTKPRKTGSTFISSMLGTAVLRAGGRVAPCKVSSVMTKDALHYGLVRRYDLLGCHTGLSNINVRSLLRSKRDVVFVTSTREPVSWFLSAAVWVYEKKTGAPVDSKALLHAAIDNALDEPAEEFRRFRKLFLGHYGLNENSTAQVIKSHANIYSYVFDHATAEEDVNEALLDLGYEASVASIRREGVYDAAWHEDYRSEDVKRATRLEESLYKELTSARAAHKSHDVPWAKLNGTDTKVVYSAVNTGGKG